MKFADFPSSESQSWCLLKFLNCWVYGRYIEVVTMDLWFIKELKTGETSLPPCGTLGISYGTSPCWNMRQGKSCMGDHRQLNETVVENAGQIPTCGIRPYNWTLGSEFLADPILLKQW